MVLKNSILINNNEESPLILKDEVREKINTSNKLISEEIFEVKNIISKIIISTKANKNKLKKLYKKDKKINIDITKLNKNKDKKILKIIGNEIYAAQNIHKKIEQKFERNINFQKKYKRIIKDIKNKNKYSKIKYGELNDLTKKILFYQNENVRLSNRLSTEEKQKKTINDNLTISENKKDELIKLIKDLNEHFLDNKIVNTNFKIQKFKAVDNLKKTNLYNEIKNTKTSSELNKIIKDIFN